MRKSLVALLLVIGAAASANLVLAATSEDVSSAEGLKLMNAQMAKELTSRASRLGTSNTGTDADTVWVGYTPGQVSATNWWGVYAGYGKDGYYRPINGVPHKGDWDFETPVHGDSLQGWWPLINLYASTGGQTRTDRNRPWWALDFGNMANYVINEGNGRTYGVTGVWHRDGGSGQAAPAGKPSPNWAPSQGSFAAWMGIRAHGDNSAVDATAQGGTGNPFNEDVLLYTGFGAISPGGNDQAFPGYGSQMDQMLYKDIDVSGVPADSGILIQWKYQTELSTGKNTVANSRTGWFEGDPLRNPVSSPGANLVPATSDQNFISAEADNGGGANSAAPVDSFEVFVGCPAETSIAGTDNFLASTGTFKAIYDPLHRWFNEVLWKNRRM